ncbi:leucine--tRNA ligase [Candidatus Xianfuyuplasma coldseepsis]|uniref:Leucine--tRNA ligase n=1 Tax=Candidatus Xianfuyuplasma coldseepsis TaxID=2782163 RepID=A0A7L7KNT4_9MOLU|nr:leucine--tRNA ligase [Xianfuyuplasma coldseepsis]QMS84317.1 leucine--tRNA ligase [Xianfuyuplasma coldseepsis]
MEYNHKAIEAKWQQHWYDNDRFHAEDFSDKPKYYALVEFPYPSGVGMHVGHIRAYSSLEIISRKRRMEGYNVLFPMGFDAFGLPTENYAIKTNTHPREVTDTNIKTFLSQLKQAGFSFDFSRNVDTTDPNYYKWTQWIFVQLFNKGLAFRDKTYVNYCPSCKVVLSNEDSQGGKCDRCETPVIQKEKDVWFLRITEYAERLLEGLKDLETLPRIRIEQENWIGKSTGAHVDFPVNNTDEVLQVYTTRPDTLFGATFMVIAPEHEILVRQADKINNLDAIKAYQVEARKKTEFERVELAKDKTGVEIDGLTATNLLTGKSIPIFVADYVMIGYGTGAIMAVPGHDTRDYEFAQKFGCDIIEVIAGGDIAKEAYTDTDEGILVNSDFLNDLSVAEAKVAIIDHLEKEGIGHKAINYKMKDWAFNRQRYWGEPIPIVHCDNCGMVALDEKDLPLLLPEVDQFEPGEDGQSPLANIDEFVHTTCPKCGGPAHRETDTMPQWAGSSWYFLRYTDPHNDNELAAYDKLKYWLPVDWYNGGMEHVTRHVIYSRFWHQFLYDIGVVPTKEPYKKRTAQGMILGEDGEKMSKSLQNTVDPYVIIDEFGADTLRLYILFIGDYEQATPWNPNGVKGARRFLDKLARLEEKVEDKPNEDYQMILHKTIQGVEEDIENVKFNTAIAKLMTLVNELSKANHVATADYEILLKLVYPFAPHIAEELWQLLGHTEDMVYAPWPVYDESKMVETSMTIVVSVNGKVRDRMEVPVDTDKATILAKAKELEKVQSFIDGKTIRKEIYVPNKLVNLVVS